MKKHLSISFVVVLSLSLLLSACGGGGGGGGGGGSAGGGDVVTFSQLPVFTGAKESSDELLLAVLNPWLKSLQKDATIKSAEGKAYDVPADTKWDAIQTFYQTELEKTGWTAGKVDSSSQTFTRGNQVVTVKYSALGLIVILVEAK